MVRRLHEQEALLLSGLHLLDELTRPSPQRSKDRRDEIVVQGEGGQRDMMMFELHSRPRHPCLERSRAMGRQ